MGNRRARPTNPFVRFEKEQIEVVSSVSSQTVQFDPELSNTLYRFNRSEPVNYILDFELINSFTNHNNTVQMVENVCRRWDYVMGTPLGRYGQGIAEPIMAEEQRDSKGLGYDLQSIEDRRPQPKNRRMTIPRDLTNFTSAGILGSSSSQAAA